MQFISDFLGFTNLEFKKILFLFLFLFLFLCIPLLKIFQLRGRTIFFDDQFFVQRTLGEKSRWFSY